MHICVTLCDYTVTAAGFWFTAEYIDNKACSKFASRQKCLAGRRPTSVSTMKGTVPLWLHRKYHALVQIPCMPATENFC